jgi:hypothetical protein
MTANEAAIRKAYRTSTGFVVVHPLDPEDAAITVAMRAMASSAKGVPRGVEARGQFDALMDTSEAALAQGEAEINRIGQRLRAAGRL